MVIIVLKKFESRRLCLDQNMVAQISFQWDNVLACVCLCIVAVRLVNIGEVP